MSNMRVLTPVLDSLVELQKKTKKRLPVLVHGVGNNVHYVVPEQLGKLAKNYPDLCFLTSQLGWVSLTDSMIDVAREHENIYLELIVTVNILAAKRIVENIGDQRLTLGTDAPWGSYTLGRKMVEEIAPEEKWDSILGGTISKLLQTT